MSVWLDYPPGATPLDADELASLIPGHITTNSAFPGDEIAVRFHHRLVAIHPFPNGNGRHARMMADLLVERLGKARFTWGSKSLVDPNDTRKQYIAALQAADARNIAPLLAFARS
jgi:Fic-DOC domain mobile mystery protein B